jgi:ABC-2 type transport system ATP-binding protein
MGPEAMSGSEADRAPPGRAASPMIEVRELRRCYAGTVALDGVSFSVHRGEVVGLLGPNGAGKTTCMRILACFVPPSAGEVRVAGLDVERQGLAVRRQLGYLPEGVPLYPELRVDEHLAFRARLRGLPRGRRRVEVDRVVERCALSDMRRRVVGQLSRGYRQRLGLADALLGDPPLLILDEPTVGLDPNQIREVRELIRALGGAHTVLLSTHILPEVEAVCDRVLILHHGRLAAEGRVQQLRGVVGGSWIVCARGPSAEQLVQLLRGVSGVAQVELLEAEPTPRCRLAAETAGEVGERIAAALHAAGWALQELRSEGTTLEEIFARLTADAGGSG